MRRSLVQPVTVVFLCALGLSACASEDKKINLEQVWNQDKQQINTSIGQMQDVQAKSELLQQQQADKLAKLQDRVETLEKQNQSQQAVVKALSSNVEHLKHTKQAKATKPAPAHKSSARKAPPKQRTTAMKALPPPMPIMPIMTPKVDKAAVAEAEKNAYTSAYLALKSGRYDEAAKAFNKQLDLYPNGEYADQAWYWLGETRFAQNDAGKAYNAFKYVVDHYANSVKHAAALLKLGQITESQKHFRQSAAYYTRLFQDHADSSLAGQAREALTRVQAEAKKIPGK